MTETPGTHNHPNDIYFARPNLPPVDTSKVFTITSEQGMLRVQNQHVSCLFRNLSATEFDAVYNDFRQHLNLDFGAIDINNKVYTLSEQEQQSLFDTMVTRWIYFYTVNNLPVKVSRADFIHPYMTDDVLALLDKKYGRDTEVSLALGTKILRQAPEEYRKTVKGRRCYYER